jgi:hypothetical protein
MVGMNQGWPGFSTDNKIKIVYVLTLKVRGDIYRVTIFDFTVAGVVNKCH